MTHAARSRLGALTRVGGATLVMALTMLLVSASPVAAQRGGSELPGRLRQAMTAIDERRFGDAFDLFESLAKSDPKNPTVLLGGSIAAFMLGKSSDAQNWAERAIAADPTLAPAYVLLAQVLYGNGNLKKAIDTLELGQTHAPGNTELAAQLSQWQKESRTEDRFYQKHSAHFSILFEGPTDEVVSQRVLEILEAAYWRVGGILSAYPPQNIAVVLYTTDQFRDITRSPTWAAGVTDGRIKLPVGGALSQPAQLERVLNHEFVHVAVASIGGPVIPFWVNEGLATALEPGGVEWARRQLDSDPTRVPLTQLHGSFGRLTAPQARVAYALSALAVKRMLDLRSASGVVNLLRALAGGTAFDTAFQQTIFMRYEDFTRMASQP